VCVSIFVAREKSRGVVGSWDERMAMEVRASWWKGSVVRSIEDRDALEVILVIRSVSWVEGAIVELWCIGLIRSVLYVDEHGFGIAYVC
jgi:hypothetical protein